METTQKLSGLQKQVLGLYRKFLRAARSKGPEERLKIESVVSAEFRHNAKTVDRKNFTYIEYLLRRGMRQVDQLSNPGTVGLSTLKVTTKTVDNPTFSSTPAGTEHEQPSTGIC